MPNEFYEKRREHIFPKITAMQLSRLDAHGKRVRTQAGDVRSDSVKHIASAVGEGSICVRFVHRALQELSIPVRQMAAVGTNKVSENDAARPSFAARPPIARPSDVASW